MMQSQRSSKSRNLVVGDLIDRVLTFWPAEDQTELAALVNKLTTDLAARRVSPIRAGRAEIESFIASLPETQQRAAARTLRRFYWVLAESGWRHRSPLPAPRPLARIGDDAIARHPEVAGLLARMSVGRDRSTVGEYRRAIGRWVAWCEEEKLDPVRVVVHQPQRYIRLISEAAPTGVPADIAPLRRFFELAIAAGARTTQPLPRAQRRGISERPDDPVYDLFKRTLRTYAKKSRPSAGSLLTEFVERTREAGYEPNDFSPIGWRRLIPAERKPRLRPIVSRFLLTAAARGQLSERGDELRASLLYRTLGNNRRLIGPYRRWAAMQGYKDAALVPMLLREQYLSGLLSQGHLRDDVAAVRAVISNLEHRAARDGQRPQRADRLHRFVGRLMLLGFSEDEADRVVAAIHDGLKPSVHRGAEMVVSRYLDWCFQHAIDPTNPSDEELLRYQTERGNYLGLGPIRRLASGLRSIGRPVSRAPLLTLGQRTTKQILSEAGVTTKPGRRRPRILVGT